jgi:ATP-dependent DNA helicase RecG
MITLETLYQWLSTPAETEHLEFKEAKQQYDTTRLLEYCVALANEGGGHLVLGVTNAVPRRVVGTRAFASTTSMSEIKLAAVNRLGIRVEVTELHHADGRVLVFTVQARPAGQPMHLNGSYLMRVGESLVGMTPDQLRKIMDEGRQDWMSEPARADADDDTVIALLDTQAYFDLSNLPYPTNRDSVLAKLSGEGLITRGVRGWNISNLAALLLAKKLDAFSSALARKAPRVVIYEGANKLVTREDKAGNLGYAVGFERLVDFVHSAAPQNRFIEQAVREEVKMFPKQALRELIANALVHQDFSITGASVMVEMYSDRVEISNPGIPPIEVERFIDEYRSRNERLADFMRRLGICEEKGSGVDKVVASAEVYQLRAPDFRAGQLRTTATLYAHQDFADMAKSDRVRACYQHCALLYVSNQKMSNQSLRQRFGLPESSAATVSQVIAATKEAKLIIADDSETTSTRYARYLPYWA